MRITIPEQIHNNAVALIGLSIAILTLAYNGWRQETTEDQRSQRSASFQVLGELSQLQELVLYRAYFSPIEEMENKQSRGRGRVKGYANLLLVRDLMNLLPAPAPAAGMALFKQWDTQVDALLQQDFTARLVAEEALSAEIDTTRQAVLDVLKQLE